MYDISQDPALSPQAPACKNEIKKYLLKSTLQKLFRMTGKEALISDLAMIKRGFRT
jgi:hypothetical protein